MSSSLVMLLISMKLRPGISQDIVPPGTSKTGWVPCAGRSPASAAGWPPHPMRAPLQARAMHARGPRPKALRLRVSVRLRCENGCDARHADVISY